MSNQPVDLELIKKYNVPGPRYTSYPPATQFTDQVDHERLNGLIQENMESSRDVSLYYHIPFCESLCWFCGCTTVITSKHQQGADYLDTLDREMGLSSREMNSARRVVQMHFGGGTPTFLRAEEIQRLGEIIKKHFTFAEKLEAGVEIDPRRLTRDRVVALWQAGFNRGLQFLCKGEVLLYYFPESLDFLSAKKSRRASPKMHLHHSACRIHFPTGQAHLSIQCVQIISPLLMF
jgi:oxygen-independent coproporphyrinogen-3 oxidase